MSTCATSQCDLLPIFVHLIAGQLVGMFGVDVWEEDKVVECREYRRGRGSQLVGEQEFPSSSLQNQKMSAGRLVPEMTRRIGRER